MLGAIVSRVDARGVFEMRDNIVRRNTVGLAVLTTHEEPSYRWGLHVRFDACWAKLPGQRTKGEGNREYDRERPLSCVPCGEMKKLDHTSFVVVRTKDLVGKQAPQIFPGERYALRFRSPRVSRV